MALAFPSAQLFREARRSDHNGPTTSPFPVPVRPRTLYLGCSVGSNAVRPRDAAPCKALYPFASSFGNRRSACGRSTPS